KMRDTTAMSSLLRRGVEKGDVHCVVAAAATTKGPFFADAFGKRDIASGAEMRTDTVIRIASMTKAVVGACAMQLVEQGRLQLDSPISAVLPELAGVQVLDGFDADGEPILRAPKRPVTLR